jgi:DNA-binding XRE family transcriptional regulator/AraC-like DNA-binding protein
VRIILFTGLVDPAVVSESLRSGADGFVPKPMLTELIHEAIPKVLAGEPYPTEYCRTDCGDGSALMEAGLKPPPFLTQHAFEEWNREKATPDYWYKLPVRARFRVPDLATLFRLPSRELNPEWRRLLNESAGRWMHRVRMVLAAYRLWQGKTATEVSSELHYREVRGLYRAFLCFFGTTTGAFAKRARGMTWAECVKCYIACARGHIAQEDSDPVATRSAIEEPACPTEHTAGPEVFVANLRFWRRNRNLTVKEAADRLGVAHSAWCQWEQGRRSPSVHYAYLIGQVLSISECALFSRDPDACLSCPRRGS